MQEIGSLKVIGNADITGNLAVSGAVSGALSAGLLRQITLLHQDSLVVSGTALVAVILADQVLNCCAYQEIPANENSFKQYFNCLAGTYRLVVDGIKTNNSGILDWYIDDLKIVNQQDWYASVYEYNARAETTGITLTSGSHILRGVVNGKNANSSDYSIGLTKYLLQNTD